MIRWKRSVFRTLSHLTSMARKFGKDEQTVFFAVKIVVPVVLSLIIAAGIDISSAAHGGAKGFVTAVQTAHASY